MLEFAAGADDCPEFDKLTSDAGGADGILSDSSVAVVWFLNESGGSGTDDDDDASEILVALIPVLLLVESGPCSSWFPRNENSDSVA